MHHSTSEPPVFYAYLSWYTLVPSVRLPVPFPHAAGASAPARDFYGSFPPLPDQQVGNLPPPENVLSDTHPPPSFFVENVRRTREGTVCATIAANSCSKLKVARAPECTNLQRDAPACPAFCLAFIGSFLMHHLVLAPLDVPLHPCRNRCYLFYSFSTRSARRNRW